MPFATREFSQRAHATLAGCGRKADARVARFGVRRDPVTGSPYYAFETEDGWVQGWIEDAGSLAAKVEFVRSRGLGGVAFFPLAYAPAELHRELRRWRAGSGP